MSNALKTRLIFAAVILITGLAAVASWPKGPDLNIQVGSVDLQHEMKVRLGLDLQGGTHLVYRADLSNVPEESYEDSLAGVRDVIERRVNALGVSEPVVQTNHVGDEYRVIIELPGVTDVSEAVTLIGETPSLDFRKPTVEDPFAVEENDLTQDVRVEGEGDDAVLVDAAGNVLSEEQLDELTAKLEEQEAGLSGIDGNFERTELSGTQLERASLQFDPNTQQPVVLLDFDEEGGEMFAELTKEFIGKPIAIYLDDVLVSAPVIQTEILSGEAQVTGNFTVDEARELAKRLNTGALPVPIELISQTNVGASLGEASVQASFLAGLIGLLLVAIFMITFYRLPGILAVAALGIYALITLALFKLFSITMTLAGVAGFILSIGLAVDANVLIFEHMREELRSGRPLRQASENGFKGAWIAIRDSNVSTLITCLLLSWFGTSIIQGFAITLATGVLVSMFSAITITRTFLRLLTGSGKMVGGWWWGGVKSPVVIEDKS